MAFIRISGPIPLASAMVIATMGFSLVAISEPPADLLVKPEAVNQDSRTVGVQ
jgi:hypothetical protein